MPPPMTAPTKPTVRVAPVHLEPAPDATGVGWLLHDSDPSQTPRAPNTRAPAAVPSNR